MNGGRRKPTGGDDGKATLDPLVQVREDRGGKEGGEEEERSRTGSS
jgi:hypothetical protein